MESEIITQSLQTPNRSDILYEVETAIIIVINFVIGCAVLRVDKNQKKR